MKKFTDQLGGRWQAHHILEEAVARDLRLGATDRIPAVILTEAEHKLITAELRAAGTAEAGSLPKLWKAYQKAYSKHPDWLAAIQSYFVKGK